MAAVRPATRHLTAASQGRNTPAALAERVAKARKLLRHCGMCELHCNVDRTSEHRGRCGLGNASFIYKTYLSANEEAELLPALRVFLGGCNLRCSFCDEAPEAFRPDCGRRVSAVDLATQLCRAVDCGVKTVSVLGGEPTLHTHTILELAAHAPRRLPLALNTNMYVTPEALGLLDGVVDWYLADFKFGNDACAQQIADAPDYTAVVQRNLLLAAGQARVIIRHVLLPGHLDCCFRPIVDWCADSLPRQRFQLYTGYVPCGAAGSDATLGRLNTSAETRAAEAYVHEAGLQTATPAPCTESPQSSSHIASKGDITVTLGVDGRVYCHDLPPELSTVLAEFRPHGEPAAVNAHSAEGARP